MNIHEYQAKELLKDFGVPVPEGAVAATPDEARAIAESLGGPVVVKAQVHAGGRGKAGGIKLAGDPDEAEKVASEILGMRLVTAQSGAEGKLVRKVLVERATQIERELYAAVVLDRTRECLTVMASPEGGMEIEEVARTHPERIFTTHVLPGAQLWPFQGRGLMLACGLDARTAARAAAVLKSMVALAWEKEATLVEVNPLVVDSSGQLVALDAKMNFDDSALFRHPEIAALADPEEADPLEREAAAMGLNYVRLGGNVGTMVNGAGLAMATMDVIKMAGAEPANFLDVGGGASEEMITKGFEIILSDPNVKAILINIFGGILRCDVLARGVVAAAGRLEVSLPMVVRLEGTNVEEGRRILAESGLKFDVAASMAEAAAKIARLVGGK